MSAWTLACLWIALGAQFDVRTLPVGNKDARIVLAHVNGGTAGDVLAIQGSTLTVYSGNTLQPSPTLTLEEGVSVFDVADIDGDGRGEVIAICGDRIQQYVFAGEGQEAAPPKDLFSAHTLLSALEKEPWPHVIVLPKDGRMLLALPLEKSMELRGLDGLLVDSFPTVEESLDKSHFRGSMEQDTIEPSEISAPGALEQGIWQFLRAGVELPDYAKPDTMVSWSQYRYWSWDDLNKPEEWAWFPLKTARTPAPRVLCARAGESGRARLLNVERTLDQETAIRICSAPATEKTVPGSEESPFGRERRYRGNILFPDEDLPDFNRDGLTDLVLWRAEMPGLSADSLTRVVAGAAWKIDVVMHLFSTGKNAYEPIPAANVACFVPITRFLPGIRQSPLSECVMRDFDGDGRTDFGCATARDSYSVWLYKDSGFSEKADFTQSCRDKVQVAFRFDLIGNGRTAIGLQAEKELYVLRFLD